MPRLGKGCEASRRWIADCKEAGRPGRGGAVPTRGGGAVPARGPFGRLPCGGCDIAGEPARKALGIAGGGVWYSSRMLEVE